MKRITHIIDEMKLGGAQTHLITMLIQLQRQYTYQHTVVGLFGDGPIVERLRDIGIEVIVLDIRDDLTHRRFDRAVNTIRKVLIDLQPDLVEAHLTWSRLLGLLAARLAGIEKRFGFEHGDIYMNSLKFRVANYLSQLYISDFIVVSDALRQWVHETHHIQNRKMRILHNCVDTAKFNPDVAPAEDVMALKSPDATLFAMVGTLGSGVNKRVDIGIQATAYATEQGENVHLVIAGDGDQRDSLEQMARDLNIADHVHFLGMRSDIPNILVACDVFCHAAPFEPFGLVVIEAMATCLPIIVPDSGGIQEVVEPNITGLVYPALKADKLGQAMIQLSQNQQQREEIGKHAYQVVQDRFSVEQYIKQLYSLYGLI